MTGKNAAAADSSEIRINIGCGGRPLPGYVNIDSDDLETMRARYPDVEFPEDVEIFQYDVFNLPFDDGAVSEVRADSFIEHLGFKEEPLLFYEVRRVLRPGGLFVFSTTDFEEICRQWLAAKDDWQEFFRDDDEAIRQCHWFGTYTYAPENRWGYLTAMIYGTQNGEGQYHRNCYTTAKIRAILKHLGFIEESLTYSRWKGDRDPIIDVRARKN